MTLSSQFLLLKGLACQSCFNTLVTLYSAGFRCVCFLLFALLFHMLLHKQEVVTVELSFIEGQHSLELIHTVLCYLDLNLLSKSLIYFRIYHLILLKNSNLLMVCATPVSYPNHLITW
jgi:hypothetical protein